MGADERIVVDTLSLADFHRTLQARLDEAYAALAKLEPMLLGASAPRPALGEFEDARHTSNRHQRLREEYVDRLRRLIAALTAAHAATEWIISSYDSVEKLNTANLTDILRLVGGEFEHGRHHG